MSKKDEDKSNKNNRNHGFKIRYVIFVVLGVVLVSIIGAIVINELYKVGNGYYTEWEASDALMFFAAILGAIGTVGLGGLTLWQNEKLREQNDLLMRANERSQKRLERINKKANTISFKGNQLALKANELNTINKIIEIENTRIKNIMSVSDEFIKACKPTHILVSLANSKDIQLGFTQQEENCDFCFMSLSRELRTDLIEKNGNSSYYQAAGNLYLMAKQVFKRYSEVKDIKDKELISLCKQLQTANGDFVIKNEKYIQSMQDKLIKVLYDNLSLDEVRSLYHLQNEEAENGQDEDAE